MRGRMMIYRVNLVLYLAKAQILDRVHLISDRAIIKDGSIFLRLSVFSIWDTMRLCWSRTQSDPWMKARASCSGINLAQMETLCCQEFERSSFEYCIYINTTTLVCLSTMTYF